MSKDFLSPSEVEKIKKKRTVVDENVDFEEDSNDTIEHIADGNITKLQPYERTPLKMDNTSGKVRVEFETMGRFDTPATMYFSGYTVDHIDNFAVVTEDNIFETLVGIIEELKHDTNDETKIENMTVEEFFETLIAIKAQFNTITHTHRWICDCQSDEPDGKRVVNETIIDLRNLNYIPITQADEEYRNLCRENFKANGVFENYIKLKYGQDADASEFNLEEELQRMKIQEPYGVSNGGNYYKFRFMRIRDLIIANRYITKKYASKIKAIKSRQIHNVKADELKAIKEEELDKLNREKGKEFLRALKASTLVSYNQQPIDSLDQKMEIYKTIPIGVSTDSAVFLDKIRFGIHHEQDFECPICGLSEKRLLQLEFNFVEFIPTKSDSDNGLRDITRGNIFMGI